MPFTFNEKKSQRYDILIQFLLKKMNSCYFIAVSSEDRINARCLIYVTKIYKKNTNSLSNI